MPDHLIAAGIGFGIVGIVLAWAVRNWWCGPTVAAIERLRSDLARRDHRS